MKDNDNGTRFHITLNKIDRDCLDFIKQHYGVSLSAGIRVAIRAAARGLGHNGVEEIVPSSGG